MEQNLKKTLLLSAGLFILGKKKIQELKNDLENNGLNKEEAEKTASEVIDTARRYKKDFVSKLTKEFEKANIFATKEDITKLESLINDISMRLEDSAEVLSEDENLPLSSE